MHNSTIPENQKSHPAHDLGQICTDHATARSREAIEELIDGLDGANLTATIKALQGTGSGSYFVTIANNTNYNEVEIKLYDSPRGKPIARGYVDKGHTSEDKYNAAQEVRGLVRAYLCR